MVQYAYVIFLFNSFQDQFLSLREWVNASGVLGLYPQP